MSKRKQKIRPAKVVPAAEARAAAALQTGFPRWWMLGLLALTAVVFWPMLGNSFTNWDDEAYVLNNMLLRGPDWKGIWSQPVVSNYHPLTVLSLALNYRVSQLQPFSYLFLNWALHLFNTCLVFYFGWLISGRERWVALFTALIFAVHPMHVESVAWISERKDVLYTGFYLLALIRYWHYLDGGRRLDYGLTFGFFLLAVLSKPAAVVLPLTLLLLDYWHGRRWSAAVWLEKVPFLAIALFFGVLTVLVQSEKALVSLEKYTLLDRLFFGCYGLVAYFIRFFVPAPLSAFHPYPLPGALGWAIRIAPAGLRALAALVWYFRKNKALVFGAFFYLVNIVLVVQFIAIGNALLAERYTYVPYVGIAFAAAMLGAQYKASAAANALRWGITLSAALVFGYLARQRTLVWSDSETLWSDAVKTYPDAPLPHANRANYRYTEAMKPVNAGRSKALMEQALADCDAALASNPGHFAALDIRSIIYLRMVRYEEALADANAMIRVKPDDAKGYVVRCSAYERLKRFDEALADCTHCLQIDTDNAEALNGRGTILFNGKKQYRAALADFDRAIALKQDGTYYLNRSRCYFMLGDLPQALDNARKAQRLGTMVGKDYLDRLDKR